MTNHDVIVSSCNVVVESAMKIALIVPFAGGPDYVINDVFLGSKSKMTSSIPGKGRGNSRKGNSRKREGQFQEG